LPDATQRWAAIYKYRDAFYFQTTDTGQGGPYMNLSLPFAEMISGVDLDSLAIGSAALACKDFIQLVREELENFVYPVTGLDLEIIDALANRLDSQNPAENLNESVGSPPVEFFRQREIANQNGSGLALHKNEDPDSWIGNFIALIEAQGDCVYKLFWDSGGPGAGADAEYIIYFLGHYWARSSTDGFSGPCETFEEVFQEEYFRFITGATELIWCSKLTVEELLPRLIIDEDSLDPGQTIEINDGPYEVTEDFELVAVHPRDGEQE
jgi:hypothetical protein